MRLKQIQKGAPLIFFGLFLFFLTPAKQTFAHRVNVFAWVDGDRVHSISKFSGGRPAKNSEIAVLGPDEKIILTGATDEKGEFSFPVPKTKTGVKIVLNASLGHRGEWWLSDDDIAGAPAPPASSHPKIESPKLKNHALKNRAFDAGTQKTKKTEARKQTVRPPGPTKLEIKKIVDDALDKKLAPVLKMMENSSMSKTSLADILSGFGHIMGIVGIALYFSSRRKKTGPAPGSKSQSKRSAQ